MGKGLKMTDEEELAALNAGLGGSTDDEELAALNAGLHGKSDDDELAELNAGLQGNKDEEELAALNAGLSGEIKKESLGVLGTMKAEKEAQFGRKLGTGEAIATYLPIVGGLMEADERRKESVEQRLYAGEVKDTLEMIKLAKSIGIDQKVLDDLVAKADSGKRSIGGFKLQPNADIVREGLKELVKPLLAARIQAREAATGQIENADELGLGEKIAAGTISMGAKVAEFVNPMTIAMGTANNIINRTGRMGTDTYTLDEKGNPVIARDETGKELCGERGEAASVKAIAGAVGEQVVWTTPLVGTILRGGGKALEKAVPGIQPLMAKVAKGAVGAAEKLSAKLNSSEGGRILLKTGEVLQKVDEKLHFGSLPHMMAKSRLTEFLDEVVGLDRKDGESESLGDWLDKVTSVENNVDMLIGMIGVHMLTAGASAIKAQRAEKRFRHGDRKAGETMGREEVVAEYIGEDAAKKLSNEDLDMMYRIVTAPGMTAEKIDKFISRLKADREAAIRRIAEGKTFEEVVDAWRESRGDTKGLEEATALLKGEMAKRLELTPEMEGKLDAKVAEYASGQEPIARKIKEDILARLKDNRVFDNPEMLDEMVAMSARRFDPEARRLKAHDLRGNQNVGEQLTGIEELGVTSWEEAEAEGLTEKDKFGRYGGGARRALNIALHGSEALKLAVKRGEISAELAEELLTAAQCELGARPAEEQSAFVDGILERAKGDESLARRMIEKLEAAEDGPSNGNKPSTVSERLDAVAAEAKADAIKERNPQLSDAEAKGAAVQPVETVDGKIVTLGEIVGADGSNKARPSKPIKPQTALEGAQQAERLKGTKLKAIGEGWMSCEKFPEASVRVTADGIEISGLTAELLAKPDNTADAAALLTQVMRIAKRNGVEVFWPDQASADIAKAIVAQVKEQGLAKAQAKLDTRAKLFNMLFRTALGRGVTYDEQSFRDALANTSNGRQYIDNHGNIYGFVDGEGVLHFNPTAINFNTPIHEYGHLALEAIRGFNNTLWKKGMDLIGESEYYKEIKRLSETDGHEYSYLRGDEEGIRDEALATMIGDRGEKLIGDKGVGAELKAWIREVWKAFKGAFGLADLTDEQVERMTIEEFVDTVNAELLRGSEFGVRRRPSGLSRSEAAKLREKKKESQHWADEAARAEAEARERWENSGMGVIDYVRSRIEAGDPEFDLDWEIARELENERAEGRFAAARRMIDDRETAVSEGYPLSIRDARDPEKVLKVLSPLIGKSAAQLGEMKLTRISEASVRHLTSSEHARSDMRAPGRDAKKLWRGTVAGMSVTDDIIATSNLGISEKPKHFNGKWKKGAIFYRAETRFAVETEQGKYEVYPCKLIVSEINGNREVYDLVEIGTPTPTTSVSPKTATVGGPQRGLTANGGAGASTAISIANSGAGAQGGEAKLAVGGIFTGSGADYEKPSLQKVGTGEGAQVYGWGLYGSTVRDIADGYAHQDAFRKGPKGQQLWQYVVDGKVSDLEEYAAKYGSGAKLAAQKIQGGYTPQEAIESAERFLKETSNPRFKKNAEDSIRFLREHTIEVQRNEAFHEHLYEQTWFTNRKPGDESHLLKWYEPVSKEQKQWILKEAFSETAGFEAPVHSQNVIEERFAREDLNLKGEDVYVLIEHELGSPQAASEFLARAGIDGVKYPVDSYGKTVKDGDKAGWNYVAFSDEHMRVDHKWRDGQLLFSIGKAPNGKPSALGDGKQRYYEVKFEDAVDKIVKNRKPIGNEHVFISETPGVFRDIGLPSLPVMMNQSHVLSCYFGQGEGVKAGNMHGLGAKLKSLPKAIAKPMMVIANDSNPSSSVIAIVKMQDRDGHTVIAPVEINGIGQSTDGRVTANIVKSAFGKKNIWSEKVAKALRDEVDGKISVFYIDSNEARQIENRLAREAFHFGGTERQLLRSAKGTVHSVSDFGSPVKGVGAQTDSHQFKRWFGGSKVVDANGEPLVVYRGAEFDPLAQETGKGVIKPEAYFTADPNYAKRYAGSDGKVRAYYLSIQHPFDIRDPECLKDFEKIYPGQKLARGKSGALDWAEASTIDGEFLEENFPGKYDGIIYDESSDWAMEGNLPKWRGLSYVPLHGGAQVKSATDNIGTFDPGNPDVRFHAGKGREDWSWLDEGMFKVKPSLATVAMGDKERNAAGLAAGIEKREALRPWTKKQSPADLAKPLAFDAADMVLFWRAVSGAKRNPHIQKGDYIAGRRNAIGLNVGGSRIELVSRLFGVIDASDIAKMREEAKAAGFFRDEDPDWSAKRSKVELQKERDRSAAELDRRTQELFRKRVETGEGGEHYATQVLGHEIGHTLGALPAGKNLGAVGNGLRSLYEAMRSELKRQTGGTRSIGETAKTIKGEVEQLIAWWHGQDAMPEYYRKPDEMFAELFGIFLTQPESVQAAAPHAYDACLKVIAENERLSDAYRRIVALKWNGRSNDRVMTEIRKTWDREAQEQYRQLQKMSRESVSLKRDWFNFALNDRFGPMIAISERGLKAERKRLSEAVASGAMSEAEAADILRGKQAEIDALKTSLYDWQRQSGGQTRLMIAGFDDVMRAAEKDGTSWSDVRDYAHLMRVIELGGRATAHGMDPARASATLEEMRKRLGDEAWIKVEKTWKAFRAVYERSVLDDPNVRELFDGDTMKMLEANKHYVTMKHRMGVEESEEWQRKIEEYRKGNSDAWDPCIDIQERMHRGVGGGAEGESGFVLHHLVGSFEATEDPIAATIRRAIEIKESAARNHLLKQMSETLRTLGAKGVYDRALEDGAKPSRVDRSVYGKLTYMDGGTRHEVIVPKVVFQSFKADPMSFGKFGAAMRFIRNTMTLWNPMFINRAYLVDRSALETNLKGMRKAPIDVLSEAFCIRGIGVPLYLANNYLARFTPICNTWVGKMLWNEQTANHYAHRAQKIARIVYEGKFGERLAEAKGLRDLGETARAAEIEQNVAIAQEMLKRNVFQSAYQFNREQAGFDAEEIMRQYGYRIDGGKDPKTWHEKAWAKAKGVGRWWNRFEEEQEAVTKIIAYLYEMKKGGNADATARTVIEQGGTPNLAARGVAASYIENATGFFWNVRKEGMLRTVRAIKDHPAEWVTKNLAQTALPALLKGLMVTGGLEVLIRKLFGDDDEKVKRSWWAPAVIEHSRFMNAAMKCVPGYYQRNYNIIPLVKFGDHVLSMRLKYSPEEFAMQNAIHTAMQMLGRDPTDPDADWDTLNKGVWDEMFPDLFGSNYALDAAGIIVGPLIGVNPYDMYRGRNVYDDTTWKVRWNAPGHMTKEIVKNFWNYSPLGSYVTTFKNGQERNLESDDVPAWLDQVLSAPLVSRLPASMLTVTSSDGYTKALARLDQKQRAYARLVAGDLLAVCIERGRLGGLDEGLKDIPPELRVLAVKHVINGWRQYHMDPRAKELKRMRSIKDPRLKAKARQWILEGMQSD